MEASIRLPPGGAVSGWGALRLARAAYFDGRDGTNTLAPVLLAVGGLGQPRGAKGVQVSREPLQADGFQVQGIACLAPVRALFDEMRRHTDWREAVVDMDMAAAAELVSISQMREFLALHGSWRRARQVERALPFSSERSRSPAEVRLRNLWELDAGLPRPLVNVPVFDLHGRLIGVPDLFDEVAGMVGEYDGSEHRTARRHTRDVRREDLFRRAGLEYFKVTGADMHRRELVVDRMLTTRGRAKFVAPSARQWTLEPPPGWEVEETLDEKFAYIEWLDRQVRAEQMCDQRQRVEP